MLLYAWFLLARPRYLDTLPNFMCSWFVKFPHQNGDSHAATTRMTQYPGPGPSPSLGGHSVIHDPCGHRLSRYKRPPECARKAAKTRDPSCDDQSKRGVCWTTNGDSTNNQINQGSKPIPTEDDATQERASSGCWVAHTIELTCGTIYNKMVRFQRYLKRIRDYWPKLRIFWNRNCARHRIDKNWRSPTILRDPYYHITRGLSSSRNIVSFPKFPVTTGYRKSHPH